MKNIILFQLILMLNVLKNRYALDKLARVTREFIFFSANKDTRFLSYAYDSR